MAELYTLTEKQIRHAMSTGEFGEDVIGCTEKVAVVMSQSWCPQWTAVSRWMSALPENEHISIFSVVYDEEPFFEEFMSFKENVFGNREVPYIRYYRDGRLFRETNYTSKDFFLKAFGQ
jgi:hypothetical protein